MENDNKVISLGEVKSAKRKSRSSKIEDLTPAMKQDMISHYIDDTVQNPVGKSPDKKFVCLSPDGVEKLVYEIKDQEVLFSNKVAVLHMLGESIKEHFVSDADLHMTAKQYKDAVDYWKMKTPTMATPKLISWKGEDCLSMRKLPFEIGLGDTPLFDELMGRITNAPALMAFIGSLLYEESNLQQYVWLHGRGGDGKGALCRVLSKALKHLYSSQVVPIAGDKFWTYFIRDKRLVVFEDCNNTSWITSGLFKNLTGGGRVSVSQKYGNSWDEEFNAKYIFCSNEKPDLSSEEADQRRIIYCEIEKFKGKADPSYEPGLWREAGFFLSKCSAMYQAMCPTHGIIDTDSEAISDLIESNEDTFSSYFETNFHLNPSGHTTPTDFTNRIKQEFRTKKEINGFKMWLERRHYIRLKSKLLPEGPRKVWVGVTLKAAPIFGCF